MKSDSQLMAAVRGKINFLGILASLLVAQSQVVTSQKQHIQIQAILNGFSKLYLCTYMYVYK